MALQPLRFMRNHWALARLYYRVARRELPPLKALRAAWNELRRPLPF